MPDAVFADPRLAAIYDDLDPDRSDLEHYIDLVDELNGQSVLDVGCGTGTFACLLARRGLVVTGLDPAEASLDVARTKPDAEKVRWILGDTDTSTFADLGSEFSVDIATMTANVAQVFLSDDEWATALSNLAAVLRRPSRPNSSAGHLIFEVRDPGRQAWLSWNKTESYARTTIGGVGTVATWVELLDVDGQFVSFRHNFVFENSGESKTSDSTLRFRERSEIELSLQQAGFTKIDIREAPDRPGCEFVFVADVVR